MSKISHRGWGISALNLQTQKKANCLYKTLEEAVLGTYGVEFYG